MFNVLQQLVGAARISVPSQIALMAAAVGTAAFVPTEPATAARPGSGSCPGTQECGWPAQCYCTANIPCDCVNGGCAATIEAYFDDFQVSSAQHYCLVAFPSVCARAYTCATAPSSSCGSDDACDPVGEPLPIPASRYYATSASCTP